MASAIYYCDVFHRLMSQLFEEVKCLKRLSLLHCYELVHSICWLQILPSHLWKQRCEEGHTKSLMYRHGGRIWSHLSSMAAKKDTFFEGGFVMRQQNSLKTIAVILHCSQITTFGHIYNHT